MGQQIGAWHNLAALGSATAILEYSRYVLQAQQAVDEYMHLPASSQRHPNMPRGVKPNGSRGHYVPYQRMGKKVCWWGMMAAARLICVAVNSCFLPPTRVSASSGWFVASTALAVYRKGGTYIFQQ